MTAVSPGETIGIFGGGQLGRFLVRAAHELGYHACVLDPAENPPAAQIAGRHIRAAYDDMAAVRSLAAESAVVIPEFENVPADAVEEIEKTTPVRPGSRPLAISQHRMREKRFFQTAGVPTATFSALSGGEDLEMALDATGLPAILKTCRFGYDGKGQARVETVAAARAALATLPEGAEIIAEGAVDFTAEISVILARFEDGSAVPLPVPENRHKNGILNTSFVPADVPPAQKDAAITATRRIAKALDVVGVFCVEFFALPDGERVLANEMAPRVHNSGHYSLDAASASQFELAVRTACNLLPVDSVLKAPAAGMMNLLGHENYTSGLSALRGKMPALSVHDYGKDAPRPGRKMGHVTTVGETREEVDATLSAAADLFGEET